MAPPKVITIARARHEIAQLMNIDNPMNIVFTKNAIDLNGRFATHWISHVILRIEHTKIIHFSERVCTAFLFVNIFKISLLLSFII